MHQNTTYSNSRNSRFFSWESYASSPFKILKQNLLIIKLITILFAFEIAIQVLLRMLFPDYYTTLGLDLTNSSGTSIILIEVVRTFTYRLILFLMILTAISDSLQKTHNQSNNEDSISFLKGEELFKKAVKNIPFMIIPLGIAVGISASYAVLLTYTLSVTQNIWFTGFVLPIVAGIITLFLDIFMNMWILIKLNHDDFGLKASFKETLVFMQENWFGSIKIFGRYWFVEVISGIILFAFMIIWELLIKSYIDSNIADTIYYIFGIVFTLCVLFFISFIYTDFYNQEKTM